MGEAKEKLKLLARDFLTMAVLLLLVILACFAYTQYWPPFLVVESASMQHGNDAMLDVIDTGDMVLLKKTSGFVTYVEGRATNYSTYGDYGDVIVFLHPELPYDATPIIHRPIVYVRPNPSGGYDVPSLNLTNVAQVRLDYIGWRHDLNVTFRLDLLERRAGYITMGDNNAYSSFGYDKWIVPAEYVIGVARGELPGGGVFKLLASGMGERIPQGNWFAFAVLSALAIGMPAGIEAWLWRGNLSAWRRRLR